MSETNQPIVILDIGSASVGGAIVHLQTSTKSKTQCAVLDYSNRYQIKMSETLVFKFFVKEIFTALEKILADLKSKNWPTDKVFVFLASPFYISQTKIIKVKKSQSFKVKKPEVNQLLSVEVQKFIKKHPLLYPDLIGDSTTLLENSIMQFKLSGYETHRPYSQEVNFMTIAQYLSITSTTDLTKIKELINKQLKTRHIVFHSFSFAVFNTLRDIVKLQSFLVIDVSGELTDIAVITDGHLAENISFPTGRNFIIKNLAKEMNTVPEEAYSRLKMYKNGQLDQTVIGQLEPILLKLKQEWLSNLYEAFGSAMESVLLPNNVFIISDDVLAGIFADWMADKTLMEFSLANQPLKTKLISSRDLDNYCLNQSSQRFDPFFQIEALFSNKVL